MKLSRRQHWFLVLPLLLVLVPFMIGPACFGFLASFTNYAPFQARIRFVGLENYARILQDSSFQAALRNVAIFTLVSVIVELGLGLLLAYLLRETFRGRGLVRLLLLVPWLVSPVASGIMWHYLLSLNHGLPNYVAAVLGLPDLPFPFTVELALPTAILTEIWRKTPLVIFLLLPGTLGIPREAWDCAQLDGLSHIVHLRHVVLPRVRILFVTIALLLVADALGTFESILMLTSGGPGTATLTPGFYSYRRAFSAYDWVGGATSGWFIVAIVLVFGVSYLFLARPEANSL